MESILDGTWGSGPWPEEVVVADVLLETGWTWRDWEDTPPYIQRVVCDFLYARRKTEADQADQQRRESEARTRHGR